VAEPGLGKRLYDEMGEVNVHVRGVLHVVDPPDRPTVVGNLKAMLGERGTAYVCETNLPGDALDYLVFQRATPTLDAGSIASARCVRTPAAIALRPYRTRSVLSRS
jgi:hypothetical protein